MFHKLKNKKQKTFFTEEKLPPNQDCNLISNHKILTQGVLKIRCKRGSKARSIGGGFKLFHHGLDGKRNGAGVILKEEYLNSFVEVKSVRQNHENENHEV